MTHDPTRVGGASRTEVGPPHGLRLAGFSAESRVNGPGLRVVVWVQGCDLACRGCFNVGTHEAAGGAPADLATLAARVLAARTPDHAGVTFSGGEPFQQAGPLAALADHVAEAWPEASWMAFSGYRLEELRSGAVPDAAALLRRLDLLVDGRFEARRPGGRPWRGSRNQRLWVLGRPLPRDALEGPAAAAEIVLDPNGGVLVSGFPDARLRRALAALGD